MNYISEMNSFYDWLETNSISDSAINLWHALMHINNRAGWITEFAVAISTLETKTGLKKGAILRARLRLQQAGRIDFKSRAGQQSAVYTMIPFTTDNSDCVPKKNANQYTNRTQSETQTDTQTSTQTGTIIKLNKTKQESLVGMGEEQVLLSVMQLVKRPLGSRDQQIVGGWIDDGVDHMVILEAVKEAIVQNADAPIIYADKIVIDWDKRGLKTIGEVLEFLKQRKRLTKRERNDLIRKELTEEYDRRNGRQNDSTMPSKLPSLLNY